MDERSAYIGYSAFSGIGPQRFKLLVEYFESAEKAWNAPQDILVGIGLGPKLTQKFLDFRSTFVAGEFETALLKQEIKTLTRIDTGFPKRLREIPDPPIALYIKGSLPPLDRVIAVVGTRKPTSYGKEITEKLVRDLALQNLVIISGLARGIDGIAHRATLEMGGQTVAVLGCGVDIIYPPEHKELYQKIIEKEGAIISEVPPGHTVLKGLFPARNRIISGMSLGILVTEGAEDSGSLITARYAAEQGREVFAVPGPITSYLSAGPTKLIKNGAKVVTEVQDILEELNLKHQSSKRANGEQNLTTEEKTITELLSTGEMHYDEIVRESGFTSSQVGVMLTQLELSGIIRPLGNGKYGLT